MTAKQNELNIPIHYRDESIPRLHLIEKGDWIDIAVHTSIEAKAGTSIKVDLGFSMVLPEGYEAHLLPRSSTFPKYGLILGNSMGIIDNTYSGLGDYWGANFYATRDIPKGFITPGTRLLQFRIIKTMKTESNLSSIQFIEDDELFTTEDRGGFGSTGK